MEEHRLDLNRVYFLTNSARDTSAKLKGISKEIKKISNTGLNIARGKAKGNIQTEGNN